MAVMTNCVLTESGVDDMGDLVEVFGKLFPAEAKKLIASHRLLQRRVRELEQQRQDDIAIERTRE